MIHIDLDSIDRKYTEIADEVAEFKTSLSLKCQQLQDLKVAMMRDIQSEFDRVKTE